MRVDGYGVSFVHESHLRHRSGNRPIDCFSFGEPRTVSDFVAATRKGSYISRYAQDFIEIVKRQVARSDSPGERERGSAPKRAASSTFRHTLATDRRNRFLNIRLFSSLVVSLEAEMEDMMIAPPVDRGLMAAAKEVATMAAISSMKLTHHPGLRGCQLVQ